MTDKQLNKTIYIYVFIFLLFYLKEGYGVIIMQQVGLMCLRSINTTWYKQQTTVPGKYEILLDFYFFVLYRQIGLHSPANNSQSGSSLITVQLTSMFLKQFGNIFYKNYTYTVFYFFYSDDIFLFLIALPPLLLLLSSSITNI